MKYYLSILITCLSVSLCYGQLHLNTDRTIQANEPAVSRFIKENHIDEALIAWFTSNWMHTENTFYCLLKQDGNWYAATLISAEREQPVAFKMNLKVKEAKLNSSQADSLMNVLKPDSAFKYTQNTFAKLGSLPVEYTKDGVGHRYSIHDAGVYHLLKLEADESSYRTYYAPADILRVAYPYNRQYGILLGFVNTADGLTSATKALHLW